MCNEDFSRGIEFFLGSIDNQLKVLAAQHQELKDLLVQQENRISENERGWSEFKTEVREFKTEVRMRTATFASFVSVIVAIIATNFASLMDHFHLWSSK